MNTRVLEKKLEEWNKNKESYQIKLDKKYWYKCFINYMNRGIRK